MPGIYDSGVLTGTVNSLQVPNQFLLDTFFPTEIAEESEEIHFDVEKDVLKLAPFVSPLVEGAIVTEKGYTTNSFKPAYIKQKTPLNAVSALKRVIGERLLGEYSPQQRMQLRTNAVLMDHKAMISRRKEWMASSVLRLGSVTISGDSYPTQVVSFGRDAALTVALTGGQRWGQTGINPLADLQTWASLILTKSGSAVYAVVMGIGAWNIFKEDATVQKRLEVQRALAQAPTMKQDAVRTLGAVYQGTVDGFAIWVYNSTYVDDSGASQPMIPTNAVLMVGDVMGVQQYGAILDMDSLQAVPIFSKSWEENDPSLRVVLSQSAPLVVPYRVNATFCATVT
jgi:hypothetical protein